MDDFEIRDNILVKYNGNDEIVIVPDGVVGIGMNVFKGCKNLKEIKLLKGLKKIGDEAFYGCENLEKITLPKGLKEIGACAFANCKSLKELNLPNRWLTYMGASAFEGCSNLQEIVMTKKVFEVFEKKALKMGLSNYFRFLGIYTNKTKIIIKEGKKYVVLGCEMV